MKFLISFLWFLVANKLLLFWVWLWQLKQYHIPRFRAHFETFGLQKFISSFYRIRFPKFTKKVKVILITSIFFELLFLILVYPLPSFLFYVFLFGFLVLSPLIFSLIVLFFQIITWFFKKIIFKKAKVKRETFKNLLVIAISGSYGKSSTKEFLATILSEKFNVLKTEKNINSDVGVAQTILNKLNKDHQIFVAEVGAYERGEIKRSCSFLKPKIGILTGINEQHMSLFGSLKDTIEIKYELVQSLPKDGLAIFNGENKFCQSLYEKTRNLKKLLVKVNYQKGKEQPPWIFAEDIRVGKDFLELRVVNGNEKSQLLKLNLIGRQNIENLLLAIACARKLGMTFEEISRGCKKIKAQHNGPVFLKRENPVIIDSSYSANPNGVFADLEHLKLFEGKKVVVMPSLIELGSSSKEIHRKIGNKIAEICDFAIIVTKDRFKEIKEGAESKGMKKENIIYESNPKKIKERLKDFSGKEDVILLEGRVPSSLLYLLKTF